MAILNCKSCGANLDIGGGKTVVTCEFCNVAQTIPLIDDEKKFKLLNRANDLRIKCEFDKAADVYESVVAEFPKEAEAYWGLCLCKYGIEYVEDPATKERVPTCHRTSYDSIFDDDNFDLACENMDSLSIKVCREEAKEIDRLQKRILEIADKEAPYDVFICYKETDENGGRTHDSELAHDLYDFFTEKGYKVFFSRITLKAKLGQDYEPYIFSALNSAKVMLAIGTKYEYFNAVWVKNEWGRFLALMKKDASKTLIPCYRDIDAYDMPKEFKHLQGQDLSSPRAFPDLLTNIEKIIPKESRTAAAPVQPAAAFATVDTLLERIFEDDLIYKHWDDAKSRCNEVLNSDPKNARACVGLLMASLQISNEKQLGSCQTDFGGSEYYDKACRYSDEAGRAKLERYLESTRAYIEVVNKNRIYDKAVSAFNSSNFSEAKTLFAKIPGYNDADSRLQESIAAYKQQSTENRYLGAVSSMKNGDYASAKADFDELGKYKDSPALSARCKKNIELTNEFSDRCRAMLRSYDESTDGPYAPLMREYVDLKSHMVSSYSWYDGEDPKPDVPEPKSPGRKNAVLIPLGLGFFSAAVFEAMFHGGCGSVFLFVGFLAMSIANYNVRKNTSRVPPKVFGFLGFLITFFGSIVLGAVLRTFSDVSGLGSFLFGFIGALLLFFMIMANIKYIIKKRTIKNYHRDLGKLNSLNDQRIPARNNDIKALGNEYADISPVLNEAVAKAQKNYRAADPNAVRLFGETASDVSKKE